MKSIELSGICCGVTDSFGELQEVRKWEMIREERQILWGEVRSLYLMRLRGNVIIRMSGGECDSNSCVWLDGRWATGTSDTQELKAVLNKERIVWIFRWEKLNKIWLVDIVATKQV